MTTQRAEPVPTLELTEGGPGAALLRRLRVEPLGRNARRAALGLMAVTWLPLLVLSALDGFVLRGVDIPFLWDIGAQVRFLLAIPVFVLAEVPIGARLTQVAGHFLMAGLVREGERDRFAGLIADAARFRDSRVAELAVLAGAYVTSYSVITQTGLHGGGTWHTPDAGAGLTLAGWWYAFVSVPVFQFLLFRWLYRMLVWARFLRQVSKLNLNLTPTHPDGAGGLGFLGRGCIPFSSLLFAQSAVLASAIATRVLFDGARLQSFQATYATLIVIALVIFSGPLFVFVPTLVALKQRGLRDYDVLAAQYTQEFERRWFQRPEPRDDLLGTADVQSLADLGNSYELIRKMRVVPIQLSDFVAMAIPGMLPALPLAATVMPVRDIVKGLLHLLA
jgi:hypothetical protein